jgi:hypothetical protein
MGPWTDRQIDNLHGYDITPDTLKNIYTKNGKLGTINMDT